MTTESTHDGAGCHDPGTTYTDHLIDAIRARVGREWYEAHRPAVELEARVLASADPHLDGVASMVNPIRPCAEHFREAIRGVRRHFWLTELCSFLTDHRKEPKAAGRAMVEELARSIGCTLQALAPSPASLVESAIQAGQAGQAAHAEATRAVADGVIDEVEAEKLRAAAAHLRKSAEAYEAAANCAGAALRGGAR